VQYPSKPHLWWLFVENQKKKSRIIQHQATPSEKKLTVELLSTKLGNTQQTRHDHW